MSRVISGLKALMVASLFAMVTIVAVPFGAGAATPTFDANNQLVSFSNTSVIGTGAGVGFAHRYSNAITIGGTAIDGIVTVIQTSNAGFSKLDGNVNPTNPIDTTMSMNKGGGTVAYRVDFVKSGTDEPVILQNLDINVADIDSTQFAQFSGVQSYSLSSNPTTKLTVQTNANDASIPAGAYRFAEVNNVASNDTDQDFWAQVKYTAASSVIVTLGSKKSGTAFFGVQFAAASWTNSPTTVTPTPTSYTLSYNANGGTAGSVPSSSSGTGNLSIAGNTGTLTKPNYVFGGWNTEPDGTGVTYQSSDTIKPTADVVLYALWEPNYSNLVVTKEQTSVDPLTGGTVTYSLTAFNAGNRTLTNVVLTDAGATPPSCIIGTLAPGDSQSCTVSVTAASSAIVNVAQGDSDQTDVVNSNTITTPVTDITDLRVTKFQLSQDPLEAGTAVQFQILVQNLSHSRTVTLVTTPAEALSPVSTVTGCNTTGSLSPGSSANCVVNYVVTQADVDRGYILNTASVTGSYGGSSFTSTSNEVRVNIPQFPALTIEKSQTSDAPGAAGDAINYNVLVANTGNTTLSGVTVTDPGADSGTLSCDQNVPATLAPTEMMSCTASHVVTSADVRARSFTNTAYAAATGVSQVSSNAVTTNLDTLAATGHEQYPLNLAGGFGLVALASGIALVIIRQRKGALK
jgi:uncharacterized repeat protein (TIGR02543 family)